MGKSFKLDATLIQNLQVRKVHLDTEYGVFTMTLDDTEKKKHEHKIISAVTKTIEKKSKKDKDKKKKEKKQKKEKKLSKKSDKKLPTEISECRDLWLKNPEKYSSAIIQNHAKSLYPSKDLTLDGVPVYELITEIQEEIQSEIEKESAEKKGEYEKLEENPLKCFYDYVPYIQCTDFALYFDLKTGETIGPLSIIKPSVTKITKYHSGSLSSNSDKIVVEDHLKLQEFEKTDRKKEVVCLYR